MIYHGCRLLSLVGVQPTIHVVDVSTMSAAASKGNPANSAANPSASSASTNFRQILPQGLSQLEVKIPTEDKDVFAYYYLLTVRIQASYRVVSLQLVIIIILRCPLESASWTVSGVRQQHQDCPPSGRSAARAGAQLPQHPRPAAAETAVDCAGLLQSRARRHFGRHGCGCERAGHSEDTICAAL